MEFAGEGRVVMAARNRQREDVLSSFVNSGFESENGSSFSLLGGGGF